MADRAETVARDPEHRDAYDWATARAVGSLPVVIELCAPFLAPGGLLVAQRSGDLDAELSQAAPAFKALHLWSRVPIWIDLPGLEGGKRGLIVGEKYAPTPAPYPRRPGRPAQASARLSRLADLAVSAQRQPFSDEQNPRHP